MQSSETEEVDIALLEKLDEELLRSEIASREAALVNLQQDKELLEDYFPRALNHIRNLKDVINTQERVRFRQRLADLTCQLYELNLVYSEHLLDCKAEGKPIETSALIEEAFKRIISELFERTEDVV